MLNSLIQFIYTFWPLDFFASTIAHDALCRTLYTPCKMIYSEFLALAFKLW